MSYRPLLPHQIPAIAFVRKMGGRTGLFMAPGTCKTAIAIRSAHCPALVICRRDDMLTWRLELAEEGYLPDSMLCVTYGKRKGKGFPLPELRLQSPKYQPELEWVMVTYDLLKQDFILNWVKSQPFKSVFADESHSIKSVKTARTKAAIKARELIPRRVAMSGSAIGNDPLDIFSQCLWIDDGKTFGTNEWKFRSKYYLKSGPGWYPKRDATAMLGQKLAKMSWYVHEDDVLKLPPIRRVVKAVPLTDHQAKAYENVLVNWEVEIASEPEALEIDHVIVQLAKLRQVASGFIYYYPDNDRTKPRRVEWLGDNKIDLLIDLLHDKAYLGLATKVVVASAHTAEINRVHKTLESRDISHVMLYGEIAQNQRERARKTFYHDPNIRCFIAQADMLTGMNELTVAKDMVYISNSQKAISRQQSERRIRRKGSEHHKVITYWDLVSEGTVDVPLIKNIQGMMYLAHYILSGLKKGLPVRQLLQAC